MSGVRLTSQARPSRPTPCGPWLAARIICLSLYEETPQGQVTVKHYDRAGRNWKMVSVCNWLTKSPCFPSSSLRSSAPHERVRSRFLTDCNALSNPARASSFTGRCVCSQRGTSAWVSSRTDRCPECSTTEYTEHTESWRLAERDKRDQKISPPFPFFPFSAIPSGNGFRVQLADKRTFGQIREELNQPGSALALSECSEIIRSGMQADYFAEG